MGTQEILNFDTDDGKTVSMGVGEDGRLYWNGKRVITEERIRLEWWVNIAVIAGSLGALAQGLFAGLTYFR